MYWKANSAFDQISKAVPIVIKTGRWVVGSMKVRAGVDFGETFGVVNEIVGRFSAVCGLYFWCKRNVMRSYVQ